MVQLQLPQLLQPVQVLQLLLLLQVLRLEGKQKDAAAAFIHIFKLKRTEPLEGHVVEK